MPGGTAKIPSVQPLKVRGTPDKLSTARFLFLALLVCLLTLAVFFRDFLQSGGNLIAGDIGDNRFIIAILEHWRAVIQGQAPFTSPNFFWPEEGVLGYSESLFLLSLPYIVSRSVGLDYYLAFEISFIVFKAAGFLSMLWFLRSVVGASRPVALLGSVLFTLSNLYFVSMGHAQLATVVFTPLIAALACVSWREHGSGRARTAYACGMACGILMALVLFTSFYVGWFTIFAGASFLLIAVLVQILEPRSIAPLSEWFQAAFAKRRLIVATVLAFIVAMIPFLLTYLPVLKSTGGRTFADSMGYSLKPLDFLNVGSGNWMWGRILKPLLAYPFAAGERMMGWPPIILLLAIGGGVVSLIELLGKHPADSPRLRARLLMLICSASFLCLWVLPVRVGRWSLWWLVFKVVPGSSAIRAPARLDIVLTVLLIVSVSLSLEQVRHWHGRIGRLIFPVLACLLVAEQINVTRTHGINRLAEDALLARVKRPPVVCSSFFVTTPADAHRSFGSQMDAMLVARAASLPTLNGYSGWFPPDWNLLMFDNDYISHVRKWVLIKNIEHGLCGLDLRDGSWSANLDLSEVYEPGEVLDFRDGGNADHFEGEGWGGLEPGGSWTVGSHSVLILQLAAPPTSDLTVSFEAHAFTPPQRSPFEESLVVNGRVVTQWSVTERPPIIQRQVQLPAELVRSRVVRIEFIDHDPRSPADFGLSMDTRTLGLSLHTLRVDK
jgi:hypothetical protein